MNRIAIAALIAFASVALHAQTVERTRDRFTGKDEISYSSPGEIELGKPRFMIGSRDLDDSTHMAITFLIAPPIERGGQRPLYTRCHTVSWLVDGQPVDLGISTHRIRAFSQGRILEFINQGITDEQVAAFGNANSVEYRICRDEYQLTAEDIRAMREIGGML